MKSIIKLCKQGIKPREYILLPHIGANVHWEIINHQKQIGGIWLYMVLTLTKLDALSFRIKVPLHDFVKNIIFLSLNIAFNCTSSVVMGTMRMI